MSIIKPGADTSHIIQRAMNSKSLATLSQEEDAFAANKHQPVNNQKYEEKTPFQKPVYTKEVIADIKEYCKDKTPDEILDAMGISVSYDPNGDKRISHYGWPGNGYSFSAAGIDENALLKDVKHITRDCDLAGSSLKKLGEVETIGGTLFIPIFTKLEDLSSVKRVGTIDCNAETAEDIVKLYKKLHFNPDSISKNETAYLTRTGIYGLDESSREAIKKLGVKRTYY